MLNFQDTILTTTKGYKNLIWLYHINYMAIPENPNPELVQQVSLMMLALMFTKH